MDAEVLERLDRLIAEVRASNRYSKPMDRKTAADYLGISVAQLDAITKRGELPRAKFGDGPRARVMYRPEDVQAYFDAHVQCTAPEPQR